MRLHSPHVLCSLAVAACLLAALNGCRQQSARKQNLPTNNARQQRMHADVAAGRLAALHWPDFSDYQPFVAAFYQQRQWDPAWVNGHSPTRQARDLIAIFQRAGEKGLIPDDYDASMWLGRMPGLSHASDSQLADFDVAMTVACMRYLSDLHSGRVNPTHFSYAIAIDSLRPQLPALLEQQILGASNVAAVAASVEPRSDQYRATLQALHAYQGYVRQAGSPAEFPTPAQPLAAGAHYAQAGALAARLKLVGDLPGDTDLPAAGADVYTKSIADGVAAFQARHALPANGKLTPKTVAALNVPLSERVLELEDTLERLRWLPPAYDNAPVEANVPEYVVRTYDPEHTKVFEMKAVVGDDDKLDHMTPLLAKEMKYLVFRPYWVVTPTIIKSEIVPKETADKGYLDANDFEVVTRQGKPVTDWTLDGLAHLRYMVRQKPGPKNALGLVKFIFPNKLNIYMHSTPALSLFDRSKRDFSHGCIRLQDAMKMADWVLADVPPWTPDSISDAMNTGENDKTVSLPKPIPVVITYKTARVASDGKVHFFPDVYGYNQRLESTLAGGDPYPVKPLPKPDNGGDTA